MIDLLVTTDPVHAQGILEWTNTTAMDLRNTLIIVIGVAVIVGVIYVMAKSGWSVAKGIITAIVGSLLLAVISQMTGLSGMFSQEFEAAPASTETVVVSTLES